MSSTLFVPGMCVNHPNTRAARGFLCAECMEFADKEREKIEAAARKAKGIEDKPQEKKIVPLVAPGTMCINHPSQPAIEARFCADCVAFRNKRKAEIQAAADKAAKDSAVERTGNPNATGRRGRIADPLRAAAREAEKAERAESRAEKEARMLALKQAEDRAMLCKSKPCLALVLMRGKNPDEIFEEISKLGRNPLRTSKIHFMPRAKRNRKDEIRAERPDLIVGNLTKDLDPAPFALWIPLDPNGGNKSDLGWIKETVEIKQSIAEKYVVIHETPVEVPDRCNPSSWNEVANMTGAEVIDLRNYPDVYTEVCDSIEEDLDRATEWSDLLRENAAVRGGKCFAKTAKEGSEEYWDAIAADPENIRRDDPPAPIGSFVKETAGFEGKSFLNGRPIVIDF